MTPDIYLCTRCGKACTYYINYRKLKILEKFDYNARSTSLVGPDQDDLCKMMVSLFWNPDCASGQRYISKNAKLQSVRIKMIMRMIVSD